MKKIMLQFADSVLSKGQMNKIKGGYGSGCGVCVSLPSNNGSKPACTKYGDNCMCDAGPSVCG